MDHQPFLQKLAHKMLAEHGTELQGVAVVLPNQRAGLFLHQHLSELAGKTIWSPTILTFDKLVSHLTGLRTLDETTSWVELYQIYQKLNVKDPDGFDEFMGWAPTALQHFNEVDAYLLDRKHFYADIRSFEEIEAWSLRDDPLSAQQAILVERWHLHGRLHEAYSRELLSRGLAYNGLQERVLVDRLRENGITIPWKHVWFAGLNALTRAEEKIIDLLHENGKCSLAWDTDSFYMHDEVHGAGLSLRKHIEIWGPGVIEPEHAILKKQRHVDVVVAPNRMTMIRYVVDQVLGMNEGERQKTTVVLTEPELIAPLIDAIPASVGPLNVTMEIPMHKTPIAGSIEQLIRINQQVISGKVVRDALLDLLSNPVIKNRLGQETVNLIRSRTDANSAFMVSRAELQTILSEELGEADHLIEGILFCDDISQLPAFLIRYIDYSKENKEGTLLYEQTYQLAHSVKSLSEMWRTIPKMDQSYNVLLRIWQRMLNNTSLGLYGEPLQGLQIMGLLETRAIPLDHVIFLPANEGALPPATLERSFIPFDVRRAFDLPLRKDADAVVTYHFYRALGACSKMTLLVNGMEGHSAQQPSRFIDQIELELSTQFNTDSSTSLSHLKVQAPDPEIPVEPFYVEKSDVVLLRIQDKITSRLSPSAINTYLNCPLDFYYRYVLKLKEQDLRTADIQQNTLGNIVHSVLEWCYDPDKEPVSQERLVDHGKELEKLFERAIKKEKAEALFQNERNRYPLHMAIRSISHLLKQEIAFLEAGGTLTVSNVEAELSAELNLPDQSFKARIGGKIDRIEKRNGVLRIIDVKTGSVDDKNLSLKSLEPEDVDGKGQAVQLLSYAWAYLRANPGVQEICAVIVPARRPTSFFGVPLKIEKQESITREMLPQMDALFVSIVESMLDPEINMSHQPDSTYCKFCIE